MLKMKNATREAAKALNFFMIQSFTQVSKQKIAARVDSTSSSLHC